MTLRAAVAAAAAAGLITTVAVAISPATAATAAFTPKSLAGSWTGAWKNTTFGSTGPAALKIVAAGDKLTFSLDFGGSVFGCTDPAGESTRPIGKGTGANAWNAKGFTIRGASKALGTVKIVYDDAKRSLVGTGSNPPCRAGLSWKIAGTFAAKTFIGTVAIALPDGTKATSVLSLKRG